MPLPMLVELVNGWGTVPRAQADARDRPSIDAFSAEHAAGGVDRRRPRAGRRRALSRLRRRRRRPSARGLVTELMTSCRIQPALGVAGDRIRPRWLVPRARDALLAAAAVTLHAQLVEHDPERLGTCASVTLRRRLRGRVAGRAPALLLGHVPEPRARRRLPPPQGGRLRVAQPGYGPGHGGRGRQRQRLPRARPRGSRPRRRPLSRARPLPGDGHRPGPARRAGRRHRLDVDGHDAVQPHPARARRARWPRR